MSNVNPNPFTTRPEIDGTFGVVTVGAASRTEAVAALVEETDPPLLVTVATTWVDPPSRATTI